jgi:hypothetical protein
MNCVYSSSSDPSIRICKRDNNSGPQYTVTATGITMTLEIYSAIAIAQTHIDDAANLPAGSAQFNAVLEHATTLIHDAVARSGQIAIESRGLLGFQPVQGQRGASQPEGRPPQESGQGSANSHSQNPTRDLRSKHPPSSGRRSRHGSQPPNPFYEGATMPPPYTSAASGQHGSQPHVPAAVPVAGSGRTRSVRTID